MKQYSAEKMDESHQDSKVIFLGKKKVIQKGGHEFRKILNLSGGLLREENISPIKRFKHCQVNRKIFHSDSWSSKYRR